MSKPIFNLKALEELDKLVNNLRTLEQHASDSSKSAKLECDSFAATKWLAYKNAYNTCIAMIQKMVKIDD